MSRCMWPNGGFTEPKFYKDVASGFRWTSAFGLRTHPVTGAPSTFHYGLDMIGWSVIQSPVNGVVTFAAYNGGAGNEVRIKEDGTGDVFRLLHNSRFLIRKGDRVTQGQNVAIMGTTGSSTGVHCHEETRPGGGAAVNPIDYYRRRNASTPSGGGGKPVVPPKKRKKDDMTTAVVYIATGADKDRLGAIVDLAHGIFEPFGWFPVSYADNLNIAFNGEKAGPVTKGHYDALKAAAARKAAALGKVFVDIDDADVPKLNAEA